MIRHARILLIALLVAFGAASIADAAPKKAVRHRPKHSTRVSSGAAGTAGTAIAAPRRKATAKKKADPGANRARNSAAAKKTIARSKGTDARRRPATKPH